MPKQKTRKGVTKRVRITSTGKIVRGRAGRRHLLSSKTRKRKRQLRKKAVLVGARATRMKRSLFM